MVRKNVAALFAGIGGLERGLASPKRTMTLACEIDPSAQRVLRRRFPEARLVDDVRAIDRLPQGIDLLTAGFPCQDLSMAGRKSGIEGDASSLVSELFRIVHRGGAARAPRWLLIENVPYMLKLHGGNAMALIASSLAHLDYTWAYRVIEPRAFGVPQRRPRVFLLASKTEDPRDVLFGEDHGQCPVNDDLEPQGDVRSYGFYWTEGTRGVGWAADSVPPVKGGSSIGIPSPPAVWRRRDGMIGTIDVGDAERLQGFPAGWTSPALTDDGNSRGVRWRLVGNAVCVEVVRWIRENLDSPRGFRLPCRPLASNESWPDAAWGRGRERHAVTASKWPTRRPYVRLLDFLRRDLKPLSPRATRGYLSRVQTCTCNVSGEFVDALRVHLARQMDESVARR
jgi:DNA (cytosine-5)-methyltransferase 1